MPFIIDMDDNVSNWHTTFHLSDLTLMTPGVRVLSSFLLSSPSQIQWRSNISQAMTPWPLWIICLERREATFYIHHNRYLDTVDQ